MRDRIDRRQFVRGIGALTVIGSLAGCSGGGGGGGETTAGGGGDTTTTGGGDTTTAGGGGTATGGGGNVPEAVSSWLSNVGNFDGTVVDKTGQSSVTVQVGAQGNGGAFAFAPPAVRISTGTTVTWEWTGNGGSHNVVAESGASFESPLKSEAGFTFEHTFESSGVVTYFCRPHKSLGMKGAVVVE